MYNPQFTLCELVEMALFQQDMITQPEDRGVENLFTTLLSWAEKKAPSLQSNIIMLYSLSTGDFSIYLLEKGSLVAA